MFSLIRLLTAISFLCFFCILIPVANAGAILGIEPMKHEYTLNPGDEAVRKVIVYNSGDVPLEVSTALSEYKVDQRGKPLFPEPKPDTASAANWLTLDQESFYLEPGAETEVTITVQIPDNAEPGGHYSAVLFRLGGKGDTNGRIGVGVAGQIAMVNIFTISGDIKREGLLSSFAVPFINSEYPVTFQYSIENTGTVHLKPEGQIRINNLIGKDPEAIPLPDAHVFPGSTKAFKLTMGSGPLIGLYQANMHLTDSSIVDAKAPVTFVVFPWNLALGSLLLILAMYILGFYSGRKKPKHQSAERQPVERDISL